MWLITKSVSVEMSEKVGACSGLVPRNSSKMSGKTASTRLSVCGHVLRWWLNLASC